MARRCDELLSGWADEQPKTPAAVEAVLDLAAVITAHVARSRFVEESLIVSEERDLGYLLQLIDGALTGPFTATSMSIWMSMCAH